MTTAVSPLRIERTLLDAGGEAKAEMTVVTGARGGPTLSVLAGIHGDEPEGSLAVQAVLAGIEDLHLRGTLRAVPICNVAAAAADSRVSPVDGRNLAREFPGDAGGSASQRLAEILTRRVIVGADLLVDLHSAGRDYMMPFFAGYEANRPWSETSARAAMTFGAPLVWRHSSVAPGRTISAASANSVPSIYVEATGGGAVSGDTLDQLVAGLYRVMSVLGMIDRADRPSARARVLEGGDGNVDASISCGVSGSCVTRVVAGQAVHAGDVIAEIYVDGRPAEVLHVPSTGTVMMLRRKPQVEAGDAIAMLGPPAVAIG